MDEFEEAEQQKDLKKSNSLQQQSKESKNCCVVCCKAVFCCKTSKHVDKEVEMHDLRHQPGEEERLLENDGLGEGEAEAGEGSEQIGFETAGAQGESQEPGAENDKETPGEGITADAEGE